MTLNELQAIEKMIKYVQEQHISEFKTLRKEVMELRNKL